MRRALVIGTVLGLPLIIAAFVLGPAAFDLIFRRQSPERFLIPSGYIGWARIDFRQKDAAQTVPGFGGVLDVVDAVVFAAPVVYWCLG